MIIIITDEDPKGTIYTRLTLTCFNYKKFTQKSEVTDVIISLQLGEMRRTEEDGRWVWSRIIGTPTSLCIVNYWTALAS